MIRIIVPILQNFLQYTFLLLYNTIINSSAIAERLFMSKEVAQPQ